MKRNRHEHVGVSEDFTPRARHPPGEPGRKVGAILIFQALGEPPRRAVIGNGRP